MDDEIGTIIGLGIALVAIAFLTFYIGAINYYLLKE